MATYLAQAGTTLYRVTQGGTATPYTLPTGVSLYGTSQPCRFALLKDVVVIVNGANQDLFITNDDQIRVLQIDPPNSQPTLANGALTGTDGTYQVAITFGIKDNDGRVIAESALGPPETVTTTSSLGILVSKIPISSHAAVNFRGIYITLADGVTFYKAADLDGNTQTDLDIYTTPLNSLIIPELGGTPPLLKLVTFWKDRLWGTSRIDIDNVRWSDEHRFFSWPESNEEVIPPGNNDTSGVLAHVPRRDDIGFLRKDSLWRIVGDSNESFQRQKVGDVGVVSVPSIMVVRNICYFFGRANGRYGIFEWSDDGIRSVSEAQVDAWFNTSTYFNSTYFDQVSSRYNPDTDAVEFLFAAAGSSSQDRWISFSLRTGAWMGPHLTTAFTPTICGTDGQFAGTLTDASGNRIAVFGGSDGRLYKRDKTNKNDHQTAVAMDVDLPYLNCSDPDRMKVFLQPSFHSRIDAAGTLTITPKVGELSASAQPAISHTLTTGRERLRRLGAGRFSQMNLTHNTVDQQPRIYGIEIPFLKGWRR